MKLAKVLLLCTLFNVVGLVSSSGAQVTVVTTLPDYAAIAAEIGGDRITAEALVPGMADPHFIKPKPSYALRLRDADLFVSTGLDLELWAPVLVNKSGNRKIVDGAPGYVAASYGIELLQKPKSLDRSGGDIHIYGNPHIQTSPINAMIIARNIATGLCKVDGSGCAVYRRNLAALNDRIVRRLYGDELVELLGTDTLNPLAASGRLIPFLEEHGLLDSLGGWLAQALPFRGRRIICYHKNWAYFAALFGLEVVDYVEPKPGISPTARHVANLIKRIEKEEIAVLLAANYFERRKPQLIADRTGIVPLILPLSVGGEARVDTHFDLIDLWIEGLLDAFARADNAPANGSQAVGDSGPGKTRRTRVRERAHGSTPR